jgi:CRP-like cAMP-binding protein
LISQISHPMQELREAIRQMISVTGEELDTLLQDCSLRSYKRQELLSRPGEVPDCVFFIRQGILRVTVTDPGGTEHTVHFALEGQFIADYSSFILRQPAVYALQALEPLEAAVMPRSAIEWGYAHLREGEKLGRAIAEYYFIYLDSRIKNLYSRSPRERYDAITEVFPNLHNRVPQHMIASYLGITPVHLSRLKKGAAGKR